MTDDVPRGGDWTDRANGAKAWVDVGTRMLVVVAVIMILTVPGLFPLLKHFVVKSGKVNILGSEFEIAQTSELVQGLTIENGKLVLGGVDISTYPDEVARLRTAKDDLARVNADLTRQLKETETLLSEATRQLDNARKNLTDLGHAVPDGRVALDRQIKEYQETTQQSIAAAAAASQTASSVVQTPAKVIELVFGIVFSADANRDQAMDEYKKASKLGNFAVGLFKREGAIRNVALFKSRDEAMAALPEFRSHWKGSYVVDFRTWCPAALTAGGASGSSTVSDCRF